MKIDRVKLAREYSKLKEIQLLAQNVSDKKNVIN